jgi:hypothetical protein
MNQVKKFELKLLQENNLKMETLSVKASFKITENLPRIIYTTYSREIYSKEIGTLCGFYWEKYFDSCVYNLEILVQKLCKYLKSK